VALADQILSTFKRQRYFVYIDGAEIATQVEPPTITESLAQFCSTAELRFSSFPDSVRPGSSIRIVESINGTSTTIFTGSIIRPERTSWPPRGSLYAADVLWAATLPSTEELSWSSTDDATVVEELLESVGITDHRIESSNWTLGTLYPVLLPRRATAQSLIQRIDALAGFVTLASGSGTVYRIELPLYPGAATAAAFAYARNPGAGEYGVLSASRGGDGIDGIRNRVEITGAVLTVDYETDVTDTIEQGFAFDTPIALSQVPIQGSLTVQSDPGSGSIVFVEGDDYNIDYNAGTITILLAGDIVQAGDLHTPLSVLYDYVQKASGGEITAFASAENAYLPEGVRQVLSVRDDLIQDFTTAQLHADRLMAENNRLADQLSLEIPSNPALRVGQTITYRDANLDLDEDTPFLVTAITRKGTRMSVTAIGGDGGETGYLDPRAPIAEFDYIVVRAGTNKAFVWLNAERSWDPDGDIASYAWEDNRSPANTATGVRTGLIYDLDDGTTVTISLTVADATSLNSQVLGRTINLNGSQSDIDGGRYQYVRLVWHDQGGRKFVTTPTGTGSSVVTPALSNPLSRYYGPNWRVMDRVGRVDRPTAGGSANETYEAPTATARTYTSWLNSYGLLVYQDGSDVTLDVLDVVGALIPTSIRSTTVAGYDLPAVADAAGDWCWYKPSDPSIVQIVTSSHVLESLDGGETFREFMAAADFEPGSTWRGMAASAHDAAYALDVTNSDEPIVMSDGTRPVFPDPIDEVLDLAAWYTSSRYLVNCQYVIAKDEDGNWATYGPITYDGFIEPQAGPDPPVPVDPGTSGGAGWRTRPHPAVDDLFFVGGAEGIDDTGLLANFGTYLYALSSDNITASQIAWYVDNVGRRPEHPPAVAGPGVAPIEAVEVISDDTTLFLESSSEPVGWLLGSEFDDSGWSAAVELGA
jgi:hypothetical protein